MISSKSLFSDTQTNTHWDLKSISKYNLLLEVRDKKNQAGFLAIDVHEKPDNSINCVLYIKDDKIALKNIEQSIAQAIVDNNFFRIFSSALSIETSKAGCGYMLSTKNKKTADIMINYVNQTLQFTSEHYDALKNMIANQPSNAPSANKLIIK
jgi:hypothetical protein